MKIFILISLLIIINSSLLPAYAQNVPNEERLIKDVFVKALKVTPEMINSLAIKTVFSVSLYNVKWSLTPPGTGMKTSSNSIVFVKNNKVDSVEGDHTGIKMPKLQGIIRDNFKIDSLSNAKIFEEVLDILYPPSSISIDDKSVKNIKHENNKWIFTRGRFFRDFTGFVVLTDDKGNIQEIQYSLHR